jgi:hypothetical protein
MRFRLIATLFAFVVSAGIASVFVNPARADSLVFKMTNKDRYNMQVEFYSESRKHVWPGGNKVFVLGSGSTQRFALTCNPGEKICYGTWRTIGDELHWGAGQNDREHCNNCCFFCGRGEARVSLLDAGAPRYARRNDGNDGKVGNVLGSIITGLATGLAAGAAMQPQAPYSTYRNTPAPPAPRAPAYRRSGISGLK